MNIKSFITNKIEALYTIKNENKATRQAFKDRDLIILGNHSRHTVQDEVNLHYWSPNGEMENLGDYLSEIVVGHYADLHKKIEGGYRHLYAIGSIMGFGCQDAVVWGSGLLMDYRLYISRIKMAKLDVRCVRGPRTREVLVSNGIKCPEIYGDPAVLMPEIYSSQATKKHKCTLITHFAKENLNYGEYNRISMLTTDYKSVIDEIVASELIVSSSLHGIILAETYGVPAILLADASVNMFKYEDYYYSTGRKNIICAGSVEEALKLKPLPLPDLRAMREKVKSVFPYDLWQ